jgi:hypothetical protein
MRLLLAAITLVTLARAQEDPVEIMRRSVKADNRNEQLRSNYTWKVVTITREDNGRGDREKTSHTRVEEVLPIGGRSYTHLLERDGKPLPREEARKAQKALDDAMRERNKLSPEQREVAAAKARARRTKDREAIQQVPEAFDFRILGEETLNGRAVWHLQAKPRRDYKGPNANIYRNMEGTLWVDKKDYQWVKIEAETLDTISFGWFLARIAKGTRIAFEYARVNDELWAPKTFSLHAAVRVALLKKVSADQDATFSDYRKFQTDSRLLSVEEPE